MYLRFYVYLQRRQQASSNVSLNKCVINVAHIKNSALFPSNILLEGNFEIV